jgi:polyisoprenoid-binding protein YceI
MVNKISSILLLCFCLITLQLFAQTTGKIYKTTAGSISFYSETPMENIDAHTKSMVSAINPANKQVAAVIMVNTFQFKNSLMQEHFNEKYLETEKYPKATFSGVINENIDLMKPGTYNVTVTGKLTIHGVEQNRTIKGVITIDNSLKLNLTSDFDVKLVDHKIEVPKLVFKKIAETIAVKLSGEYHLQ